jgi:hypothetical protein
MQICMPQCSGGFFKWWAFECKIRPKLNLIDDFRCGFPQPDFIDIFSSVSLISIQMDRYDPPMMRSLACSACERVLVLFGWVLAAHYSTIVSCVIPYLISPTPTWDKIRPSSRFWTSIFSSLALSKVPMLSPAVRSTVGLCSCLALGTITSGSSVHKQLTCVQEVPSSSVGRSTSYHDSGLS